MSAVRLLCTALLLAACGGAAAKPPSSADPQLAALEHEYVVFVMDRFPVMATYLGGAAFDPALAGIDGKLRDVSPAALAGEDARLRALRERFVAVPESELAPRRRIDRSVALAQIAFVLRQHERRYQERALDTYVEEPFRGVDWQIQSMTPTGTSTYGTEEEWRRVVARVDAVPAYLAAAEAQLAAGAAGRNTPDERMLVQFGLATPLADAEYFGKTLPDLAAVAAAGPHRDALVADLRAAGERAKRAYTRFGQAVTSTFFDDAARGDASGVKARFRGDRFVLGEAEYDWALHNNLRLETSAAELYETSWPVVEATRNEMVRLARELAAKHGWHAPAGGPDAVRFVFEELGKEAPATDAEMIDSYRRTGARLVDYARRTGLFEVPEDYRLDVTVTPLPLRNSIDGAAYYAAPPFKAAGVGRFYVTPTGDDAATLRQEHNRSALADLAAHEGFPGHDWHYKVMTRHAAEISPVRWLTPGAVEDSSSMWEDSMATEGWGLYAESILAEPQPGAPDGFYTPEERLYQLRGELYRDLRVRIDTGIHTGRMRFDDAVTLFSEVVDFLPGSCSDGAAKKLDAKRASCDTARGAVARYSRWPTQAVTYRLGKDQIRALRERARTQLGPRYSPQRFHLELMKQGTIPAGYFADELIHVLAD